VIHKRGSEGQGALLSEIQNSHTLIVQEKQASETGLLSLSSPHVVQCFNSFNQPMWLLCTSLRLVFPYQNETS